MLVLATAVFMYYYYYYYKVIIRTLFGRNVVFEGNNVLSSSLLFVMCFSVPVTMELARKEL